MKMLLSPVQCLVLFLLLNFVESGRVLRRTRERVRKQQLQKAKQHVLSHTFKGHRPAEHAKEGRINQPLDHFDQQGDETFPQRFFVNEAYWERPHGPVFLYIGGEEAISEFNVLAGHHVDMAEEHGALLVALEHRFYGDSINPDGLETKNMADLSSVQALADMAEFHQYMTERFGLSHLNTWISFGGSYAGALSAWFRGKFPHLVYGAVASSAPVKAKLDFSTFNKIVGLSLMNEDVGGSEKCVSDVWEAFAAVEAQLMGGNATEVAKDFGCCEVPEDLEDQIELMQSLADIITGTVQFNDESSVMSIDELCVIMTNKSEAYEEEEEAYDRFVRLVQVYRSTGEEECLDASHEQAVNDLLDTSEEAARSGDRQWLYQCCTEFGFFETCEDASCPFSRIMTLQAQTQLCRILFNIPEHSLAERIAFTNKYYGADHPRTHRVLYVNGGIDPWQELSVVKNGTKEGEKDQAVFIENTSHCADMMMSAAADRRSLKKARKVIERHVAKWLKVAVWENMLE